VKAEKTRRKMTDYAAYSKAKNSKMSVTTNAKHWYLKKRGKMQELFPVKVEKFRIKGSKGKIEKLTKKKEELEQEIQKKETKIEEAKTEYQASEDEDRIEELKEKLDELEEETSELYEELEEIVDSIDWGSLNIVFDSFDRGRTIIDEEKEREYFELMNEPQARGKVNYNDLDNYVQEPLTSIVMISRKHFIPVNREFDLTEEMGDESGWPKLKYAFSLETYIDYMREEWRVTRSMAENEAEKWWQDTTIQAFIMFLGAGIFFILLAYGQGQFFMEPMTEQMASLESALNEFMDQQGGLTDE